MITKSQLEAIDKWFTGYCKHWICSLTNIIKKFDLKCSPSTLCCALTKHGFHMQTPKMKEWLLLKVKAQRLAFAKLYKGKKKQFWRRDIYTDESTPNTRILRRLKLWQRKRDRHCLDCIQFKFHLGRKSFMAQGAIGFKFKSRLIILTLEKDSKGFNQKAYERQILRGELGNIAKREKVSSKRHGFFRVEDNSKVYKRKDYERQPRIMQL